MCGIVMSAKNEGAETSSLQVVGTRNNLNEKRF